MDNREKESLKIAIGQSDNWRSRPPFSAFTWRPTWTKLSKALADFNIDATREFTLKPEQEEVVKALHDGNDVLAVLPTRYGKTLIYQIQVIRVFSRRYQGVNSVSLEIRQCNFKVFVRQC